MRNTTFLRFSFLTILLTLLLTPRLFAQVNPYDIRPFNNKYAASHTEIPESLVPIDASYVGVYQWESSVRPIDGFNSISGATSATYTFSAPLAQTTYFRRRFRIGRGEWYYSNIVKLEVVSVNWEDINYIREHDIRVSGHGDWKVIDQLNIGTKLQSTGYMDGLGRIIQIVARQNATPQDGSNDWGDIVQITKFDQLGREPKSFYPYTTANQSGKFKTNAESEQSAYYASKFGESTPFVQPTYESSPLNRVTNIKKGGAMWSSGSGENALYDFNTSDDDVKKFVIGYSSASIPVYQGEYPANTLYKYVLTDEYRKKTITFVDFDGNVVLKKVQLQDIPSLTYDGWICTYNVYDDFGLLRYVINPEGVNWLTQNSWSFNSIDGTKVLEEQCSRYEYNANKQVILKKSPGIAHTIYIYDSRDRLVYRQDGNQRAKSPAEWNATIYDDFDRPIVSLLFTTTKNIATLQSELDAATGVTSLAISSIGATVQAYANPISSADLNNAAVSTILEVNYYDNYSYNGVKLFNSSYDNLLAYPSGGEIIAATSRTLSMPTGKMARVLGTTNFLSSTTYYDDRGKIIQTLEDNILTGLDVTTIQYKWDGRILSANTRHTASSTATTSLSIIGKYLFDDLGRITGIEKKYGSNDFIPIVAFAFDDLGRTKTKRLAPGYTGNGGTELESLLYSYNLHGNLTGINKDYALKTPGLYGKWGHFFGIYLGFENSDNSFTAGRLDGRISGIIWNTQGDDTQRKFEYEYDNAGRVINAFFRERRNTGDSWSNGIMDFSSTGGLGKITYDLNGNLITLQQKGVVPGLADPITIDDLQYSYASFSNRLKKVTDGATSGSANGKLGDFKDGPNGSADDYVYDTNGNLIADLNKDIKNLPGVGTNGIKYNYFNQPEEIKIDGKGVIKYIYGADGRKLQRQYTPDGSTATATISYINQFVYSASDLQYINFEEGRIRVITSVAENNGLDFKTIDGTIELPGSKKGVFDYYIKDHQSNTRMILTLQTHIGGNSCTMEVARAANEEAIFGQVDANGNPTVANEVAARFPTASIAGSGWSDNTSAYVSRLGALSNSKIGPNTLLKVMAGDKVSATAQYFYPAPVTNGTGTSILTDLLGSLVQSIAGGGATTGITKSASGNIGTLLNSSTPLSTVSSPDANNSLGNAPKAYLTLLFFDERFNFVQESSQTLRVSQAGNGADPLTMLNIKAPKNGYAYVYVSNESDEHVYFDNLQVSHNRGHILEENHYYAFGLKIAALSSRQLSGSSEQVAIDRLYQGDYNEFDGDIQWNDFALRSYDPQIGRWVQRDPFDQFASGYEGMGNDPINNVDPSGGVIASGLFAGMSQAGKTAVMGLGGAIIGGAIDVMAGGNGLKGMLLGAGAGIGGSFGFRTTAGAVANTMSSQFAGGGSVSLNISILAPKAVIGAFEMPAPTRLTGYIGKRTYYLERHWDFKRRAIFANQTYLQAPSYYKNYGNKYLVRFQDVTRQTLSKDGRKWLDQTLVNLQTAMEIGLSENPGIELDDDLFTQFAYQSHVQAYLNAGVLKLSILDKVKIMLTPDASDLLSPLGLEQVQRIAKEQLVYYLDNPFFAIRQALQFSLNLPEITSRVSNYASKYGTDPKEIFKIIRQFVGL
jgi:RHS repeat-associated protein